MISKLFPLRVKSSFLVKRLVHTMSEDTVLINKLHVQAITGKDFWNRPTLQPLEVSVELKTDFKKSSEHDDLKHSLNYAVISRNLLNFFEFEKQTNFKSFENLGNKVSEVVLNEKKGGGSVSKVTISGSKTEIKAAKISIVLNRTKSNGIIKHVNNDQIIINGLRIPTVIGVFTFERLQKQFVDLDLTIEFNRNLNVYEIIEKVSKYVEYSNFKTVEALIESVSQLVCEFENVLKITAKVEKPNAITFADGVGVEVSRSPIDFKSHEKLKIPEAIDSNEFNLPSDEFVDNNIQHNVFIAFGSNIGNQIENILTSIEHLNEIPNTKVLETSSLYESEPMYHLDQPKFINGVLKLSTNLSPQRLLENLKRIEYQVLNREKIIDNGPRSIDLDILLYDDLILNETNLIIPHIRMIERTFVLQPLCELVSPEEIHPVTAEPFHNHLDQLYSSSVDKSKQKSNLLKTHVPLYNKYYKFEGSRSLSFDLLHYSHKTLLMGILNTTPDSFSDGGKNASVQIAIENALKMVEAGVDIIDIGGVSTRPGSVEPIQKEEWERVVPIVQAIRKHPDEKLNKIIISVDTYRSKIALDSIKEGADIINDISGGLYDDKMFEVVADTGAAYIMNHTRGTPSTMSSLNQYVNNEDLNLIEYNEDILNLKTDDLVLLNSIGRELSTQYEKAVESGVKRWQIITDPGIGFAKDLKQNLSVIRGVPNLKNYSNYNESTKRFNSLKGLPILLGPSRKKFIGTLTNEKIPSERVLTTGAVIMSCVGNKSDIVRVHDVEEVKKVLIIGDALYREII